MAVFRNFHPADALPLSKLIRLTITRSNAPDYGLARLQPLIDYFSAEKVAQLNRERICLVADDTGVIVGTGALDGDHIRTFFVHPDFQRSGIGSTLLTMLEKVATDRCIESLYIDASTTGAHFYEGRGYVATGVEKVEASGPQIELLKNLKLCRPLA